MRKIVVFAGLFVICFSVKATYDPDWWKNAVFTPTPTNDYLQAASVLRQQQDTADLLTGADYSAADAVQATNLWMMLAVLHGDLRCKKIVNPPPVFRNFGIITNQTYLQMRIMANEEAKRINSYENARGALEERIDDILKKAATSEALASFQASERNAIVSNIVTAACLTPAEAASLGLTNVVQQVSD